MFTSFRGIESGIQDKLNGAVLCGPFPNAGLPIGGLTLVFSNPADTITFDGSVGDLVTAKVFIEDVLTILPTFHAEIRPLGSSFYVSIWFDTGFTIAHTGTANSALGLSTTVDTISAGAADPAKVVSFSQGSTSGYYALILSSLAKTFEDTEIQSSGTGWGTGTLNDILTTIHSTYTTLSGSLSSLSTTVSGLVTGVSSVFGRTGPVVQVAGDYGSNQITNQSSVPASTWVSDALNYLFSALSGLGAITTPSFSANNYTGVLTDKDQLLLLLSNGATAGTWTIPPHSSVAYPVPTVLLAIVTGTGQITPTGGAGVTVNTPGGQNTKNRAQYSLIALFQTSQDNWVLAGDLEAT